MEDADTVNYVYSVGKLCITNRRTTADYKLDQLRELFLGMKTQSVA